MINPEKVTFVYQDYYNCLLSLDRHLYTWNYLAARLQHMYLHWCTYCCMHTESLLVQANTTSIT